MWEAEKYWLCSNEDAVLSGGWQCPWKLHPQLLAGGPVPYSFHREPLKTQTVLLQAWGNPSYNKPIPSEECWPTELSIDGNILYFPARHGSHICLLSTQRVASETEQLNF